jgi:DNA-binding Xre family transcriptional regulator
MAKSFRELEARMPPESLTRAKLRAKEMMAEMLLSEIRQAVGLTQATLSRLESQEDMQVSTLQRLIRALGGELEIIAHLPCGTIRISQFGGAT